MRIGRLVHKSPNSCVDRFVVGKVCNVFSLVVHVAGS